MDNSNSSKNLKTLQNSPPTYNRSKTQSMTGLTGCSGIFKIFRPGIDWQLVIHLTMINCDCNWVTSVTGRVELPVNVHHLHQLNFKTLHLVQYRSVQHQIQWDYSDSLNLWTSGSLPNCSQAWTKCSEHVSTADRVIILETPVQQIEHKVRRRGLQHMGKLKE